MRTLTRARGPAAWWIAALAVVVAGAVGLSAGQPPVLPSIPVETLQQARTRLDAGDLRACADLLDALAREPGLGAAVSRDLREQATRLRTGGDDAQVASTRALLDRLRALRELRDSLQGGFAQTQRTERFIGGHATAMGPAPAPLPDPDAGVPSPVTFVEAARLPTKTFSGGPTKAHILESTGTGVALVDVDGDGLLDIFLVNAPELTDTREQRPHPHALYRNLGNWHFEDISQKAGIARETWGQGVCAGDVDGDGHIDLYVTNWGPDILFRNRGDGTFEDTTAQAGVAAGGWSTGCAFLDADGDGDLDLYVARYVRVEPGEIATAKKSLIWRNGPAVMVGPAGLPGEPDIYFENIGNGRFREATDAAGLRDTTHAYGLGVVATDLDDDGRVDLFVANDSNPNFLYRNVGNGRFENIALVAGVGVNGDARAQAGMGVDAGDADGDGRMDLVLTAFAHDRNSLYRNLTGVDFEDVTVAFGLAAPTFERMGWGISFLDADLDGRLDLFVVNGHIFPDMDAFPQLRETFRQRNQLLLNAGTRFRDVSETAGAGLQVAKVGRGLAVGDLDNDGDLDVVVTAQDDVPTVLENRQQTGHHWIGLELRAPQGNRFAIGARVTLEAGGRTQLREVRSGSSYLSQGDLRVFAGLGTSREPVTATVRLPGGRTWRFPGLTPDRLHRLVLDPASAP